MSSTLFSALHYTKYHRRVGSMQWRSPHFKVKARVDVSITGHVTCLYGVVLTGSECQRDGGHHSLSPTRPPIRPPNGWFMDLSFYFLVLQDNSELHDKSWETQRLVRRTGKFRQGGLQFRLQCIHNTPSQISTEKMGNFLWDVCVQSTTGTQRPCSRPPRGSDSVMPSVQTMEPKAHFNNVLHPEHIWQFSWNVCAAKWSLTLRDRCTGKVHNDFFVFKVRGASGRAANLFILDTT